MSHTKLLCLRNIRFFKDGHLISAPADILQPANSVAVTFEMQKNNNKHDTVIHGWTDDPNLCPVFQWAHLVNWIWTYPGTPKDTPVCVARHQGRLEQITSQQVLVRL
jgi:hypothetical protein